MAAKAPIALIHSALGRAGNWRPFLNAWKGPSLSPLLIELPGHGLAEDWDQTRDFSDQALELALEEMPKDPVPLVGHSFGAVLALRLAVERPARVSSLVLIEPVFFAAAKGEYGYEKYLRDMAPFDRKMQNSQFATAAKDFHALWGTGQPWAEVSGEQKSYMTDRLKMVEAQYPLLKEDRPGILKPGRIEALEVPVTFVDGGESHQVMAVIISKIGDRLPDAEWVSVEGAGHMVPVTHPEAVVKAVRDRLVWP